MIRQLLNRVVLALRMANYKRLAKRREPERLAYQAWVAEQDAQIESIRRQWQSDYANMHSRPLISVVMPVYNAPLHWLDAAIESVRRQVYQEWELCIADDCSPNADVMPYLLQKAQQDQRIKVVHRATNGHISEASNTAIELSTGEFIALLDQDDLLSEDALLSIALAVEAKPNAGIIYSDEDKINEHDLRESPCRKN